MSFAIHRGCKYYRQEIPPIEDNARGTFAHNFDMPRLTNLDDLLFPVEEYPVFASVRDSSTKNESRLLVPGKKAIVNMANLRVLGIVGRDYRLVTNREALDMAIRCSYEVFPETKPREWAVKAVDAPFSAGYCYFDLLHNSTSLDFQFVSPAQRPEAFGPFIRVTNSYNTLRALDFNIGFYRKVCLNGLILPDSIVRITFMHSRREIGKAVQFKIDHERLAKLRISFDEFLCALRDCAVPRKDFDGLVRSVLLLHAPQPTNKDIGSGKDWQDLIANLDKMYDSYAGELGENAYAAFNVITDFASHPPSNRCVRRERHGLQRLAGTWISSFSRECREPNFSLTKYLEKVTAQKSNAARGRRERKQEQLALLS
jgi:hypothetical protein